MARIEDSTLIPLGELPDRLDELDPDRDLVAYCKTGRRSAAAVQMLLERGFNRVRNLEGGIVAWAQEIDPSMTRY